jgi:mannan endo-1,4-beta-mannosidase
LSTYFRTIHDVYSEGFNKQNYDQLRALAGDKLIALGEVGNVPDPVKLNSQPDWVWFMKWGDPWGDWDQYNDFLEIYKADQTITLDELPWVDLENPQLHFPILK